MARERGESAFFLQGDNIFEPFNSDNLYEILSSYWLATNLSGKSAETLGKP
jgi:hypothetical protein